MGFLNWLGRKLAPYVEPDYSQEEEFRDNAYQRLTEFQSRVTLERSREPRGSERPGPYIQTSEIVMPEHRTRSPQEIGVGDAPDPEIIEEGGPPEEPFSARWEITEPDTEDSVTVPSGTTFDHIDGITDDAGGGVNYVDVSVFVDGAIVTFGGGLTVIRFSPTGETYTCSVVVDPGGEIEVQIVDWGGSTQVGGTLSGD